MSTMSARPLCLTEGAKLKRDEWRGGGGRRRNRGTKEEAQMRGGSLENKHEKKGKERKWALGKPTGRAGERRAEAGRERRERQPASTLWWARRKNWPVQLPNGGAAGRSPRGLVPAPRPGAAPRPPTLGGLVGAELHLRAGLGGVGRGRRVVRDPEDNRRMSLTCWVAVGLSSLQGHKEHR